MIDPVLMWLNNDRENIIDRLKELVRCQSVSTDSFYSDGMADARALLVSRLNKAGFANVGELEAGGHPAIYAEWLEAPAAPTFIVYGHYDVQPPDPVDKWHSAPFDPEIRDGRLYGRGVSDDKGPSSIALETLAAFLSVEGRLPINVKILLEGEEETGSATLRALLRKYSDRLAADAVLSADGARWRADLASVNVGSRGNARCEIALKTASKDLHSGRFGGAVRNALHEMSALLASLHDRDGGAAVAGFYDGVVELDDRERQRIADIPFDEDRFFDDIGASARGEPGYSVLEQLWARPTLEINGMWGGYTGEGSKTVTPCEAFAKLTMRLVPGQDPEKVGMALAAHLRAACPPGVDLSIDLDQGASAAYLVPKAHPLLMAAEIAIESALGTAPVRVRTGGTLPLSDIVKQTLGLDTVMLSFSTADEDFHAPNEFFRLSAIDDGVATWVKLIRMLGGHTPGLYSVFKGQKPTETWRDLY